MQFFCLIHKIDFRVTGNYIVNSFLPLAFEENETTRFGNILHRLPSIT